jgi:hypothetical protein
MLKTKVVAAREFSCAAAFSGEAVDRDPDANLESGVSCFLKIGFLARHIVGYDST